MSDDTLTTTPETPDLEASSEDIPVLAVAASPETDPPEILGEDNVTSEDVSDEAKEPWQIPRENLKQIVEGMLFVSGRVLTEGIISKAVSEARKSEIRLVLSDLMDEWSAPLRGMQLMEINNGFQFRSNTACAPYIREMLKARPTRLSKPALETLAIVAYRQPVTRADIEDIRGVDSGAVIKTLLDKKLVKILGKREEPGRPIIYGTSKDFLETFHIRSLKDLPTLQEYQELSEEHRAMVDSTYSRDEVSQAEEEQDKLFVLPESGADESPVARDLLQAAEDLEIAVRQVDETVQEVLNRVPYDELAEGLGDEGEVMGELEVIATPRAPRVAVQIDDVSLSGDLDDAETWEEPEYPEETPPEAEDEEQS